jgi:PKD repeat protein
MKKFNLILLLTLFLGAAIFNSCKDDPADVIPDAPAVSAPSSTTNVGAGQSVDVSFTVNVPGGYASSNASAQGGNATVSGEPDTGATSGTVVISFTAGQTEGAASVTLTVTDQNQKSDNATAVLSVDVEETEILVEPKHQ